MKEAQSYLESGSYSRDALIQQLVYAGFSKASATFGVDHINVDWNEQAVKEAQSYLESGSYSRDALIQQLEYVGFTSSQAAYGADSSTL